MVAWNPWSASRGVLDAPGDGRLCARSRPPIRSGGDFVAVDQYELFAEMLRGER